ncbi:MAG: 4'-phosphopantetheinyl transferase superfamily protein [Gammaproteobacteria bacterium]
MQNNIQAWMANTDELVDSQQLKKFLGILSDDERGRYTRFKFDRDRYIFLISHTLLRLALSQHHGEQPPESWQFRTNHYGRPELGGVMSDSGIRFNLSHTHGLAACVVTQSIECGIDVENLQRTNNLLQIAKKMFSENEVRKLRALSDDKQREAFLVYWTLKEAYVKARGIGLSLPTQKIEFDIENRDNITVQFGHQLQDQALDWHFIVKQPASSHSLALALKIPTSETVEIAYHKISPADFMERL